MRASGCSAVNLLIALCWFHPRPFMDGLGVQWLAHATETSLPSDHATLSFGIALGLLVAGRVRTAGAALGIALLVAWSRVYLGVHYPLDMAASLLVAGCSAALVASLRPVVDRQLLPRVLRFWRAGLRRLRVPHSVARP